jgi:hypothetical protein
MHHHAKPTPSCRPSRRPGRCPKPTGKGETLADLIQEYKWEYGDQQQADREQYRDCTNLAEAIKAATGTVGKVPDHQRRVGRETLKKACNRLFQHQDEIQACKSFEALLALVERQTPDIYRFGKLAMYDTVCRLGVYLGLDPKVIYLHAGTTKGARALGLDTSRGYLEMDDLPKPFRLLEPWECEDFLCIFKGRLAALKTKPFQERPRSLPS